MLGAKPKALLDIIAREGLDESLIHGHHIVMKQRWIADARGPVVREAQEILKRNEISILGTKRQALKAAADEMDNLAYAING